MSQSETTNIKTVNIPGVDGQVLLAATKMTDDQRRQPEWLWCGDNLVTYGRWQRRSDQAPYIRLDIALSVIDDLRLQLMRERMSAAIARRDLARGRSLTDQERLESLAVALKETNNGQ